MTKSYLNTWHNVLVDRTDGYFTLGYGISIIKIKRICKWLANNNIEYYQFNGNYDFRFKYQNDAIAFKLMWGF